MSEASDPSGRRRPERTLGPLGALALVVGSMLGIGIFISPPGVAAHVAGPGSFLAMWLLGGLTALFGALSLAELGAMSPRDGGDYPYLRDCWGPGIAFSAGWLQLLAIFPGSLASVAVATATYQFPVLFGPGVAEPIRVAGVAVPAPHVWAALLLVALTAVNHVGLRISGALQVVVTSIPLTVLLVTTLIVLAQHEAGAVPPVRIESPNASLSLSGLAAAYLPVYFAYSGWNAAIYVGGEIRQPGRNLPLSLVGGTAIVTVLYMVLCIGFLAVLTFGGLAGVGEAGTATAQAVFGPIGVTVVTGLIVLAMIGTINGSVLTGSRIAYAMAEQGDCAAAAARLHPRFATPVVGLWMQCGIALSLLLLDLAIFDDGLQALIAYTSSAMLITGTLTVLSVVLYRRREPDRPRPYRTWLYPLPPVAYALSSVVVLAVLAHEGNASVWLAVGWFAVALLFHRLFRRDLVDRSSNGRA